ncbi:unnamed protein product, partial [Porites lobata]
DRAARLKADVLQRLAAINKKLTVLRPGLSESQNMSGSPPSPLNQNIVENGATSSSTSGSNDHRKGPHKASALFATKGGDRRCAFCLGGHPPEDCKTVQDVKE